MKVYLDSIGCRLNHSEIERMARSFQESGAVVTEDPAAADLIVINTCTVTAAADSDSRSLVRKLHRNSPGSRIALTGCWSTLRPVEGSALPGVEHVIPNAQKELLPKLLLREWDPPTRSGSPSQTTAIRNQIRTRSFIKVQDGCDHECTFCLTTLARGPSHSVPLQRIVQEVRSATDTGAQEVILSGVSLNSYGKDLEQGGDLTSLLRTLLRETDIPRIRLSSLAPWGLTQGLLELYQHPRICPHLHLPLQSGSRTTLHRMRRPIQPEAFKNLLGEARAACPEAAITTDLMVGFAGETEKEFEESCTFVHEMGFSEAHVFMFSSRPGTPAARMRDQIPSSIKRERRDRLMEIVADSAFEYRNRFLGKTLLVLWITASQASPLEWKLEGVADNSLRVRASSGKNLWNQRSQVRILQCSGGTLMGVIQNSDAYQPS